MRLRKEGQDESTVELNMTPMIDCTFLLLIFFMTVSNLTTLNAEDILLPVADAAEDVRPEPLDAKHVIVNVRADGTLRVGGRTWRKDELAGYLRLEAAVDGMDQEGLSRLWLTIRGDRATRFENVQTVLDGCSQNGIYKTRVMATKDDE